MGFIQTIISGVNDLLYTYVLIILLIGAGIYFTVRTNFMQVRLLPEALKEVSAKKEGDTGISSFQALMISTASRVGTGNIAGVASAIAIGGPGAIFWMWLLAFIGATSAFVESTLAQIYKVSAVEDKTKNEFRGGPAYYIEQALGMRWLAIVFSVLIILCFGIGFNALQSYNTSSALGYYVTDYTETMAPMIAGIVLASLTAWVIFGGVHRIGFITSKVVPFMALLYMLLGIYVIVMNITIIPTVIATIMKDAFDMQAIFGGFTGSCVMAGMKRGLFSNEAGMGSAPNAAATANTSHPAKQGLVQMVSVFLDTLVICTTTALILLCSDVQGGPDLTGMAFVQAAIYEQVGAFGVHFISLSIFFFGFTSLVGNYYYTEPNVMFIKDDERILFVYRLICVFMVFIGTQMEAGFVWDMADMFMGLMATVNVWAILMLAKQAFHTLEDYTTKKKAGAEMIFKAKDIDVYHTEYWK